MTSKRCSPFAARNTAPILEVLETELLSATCVLEIGAGTGQHAAAFAAAMPHLQWQPSDRRENLPAIAAWVEEADVDGLKAPVAFDVLSDDWPVPSPCDAVYSANTAHIMGLEAVEQMFRKVGAGLSEQGLFCLYGPFSEQGEFNAPSNASFHQRLREEDENMGIRALESLDEFAHMRGMRRQRYYAMPANNLLVVWQKAAKW